MSNPRVISRTALVLALVIAGLTACGSDAPQGAGAAGGTNGPSVSADSGAGSGGRYGGGSGYGTGGGGGGDGQDGSTRATVTADASNFQFTPSTIDIGAGQVLGLTNTEPSTPHTFTVDGQDIDVTLDAGSTATVTIDLAPGRYPFRCRFHASQGMKGTLVVA